MLLPSKELLSEVLGKDVCKVKEIENNTLIYGCLVHAGGYDEINIHELAHKCKEWAIDLQGGSAYFIRSGNYVDWFCETGFTNGFDTKKFIADTEPEAIFKACDYIMEQIK